MMSFLEMSLIELSIYPMVLGPLSSSCTLPMQHSKTTLNVKSLGPCKFISLASFCFCFAVAKTISNCLLFRSPLITTMPYISVQKYTPGSNSNSNTKSPRIIGDDTEILTPFSEAPVRDDRRTHFREAANRKNTKFTPDHYVECDFCHGMLSFAGDGLAVSFPMVSFDLMKYWDGRPVWFVCCERDKGGSGPGEMIWCVGFEIIEGEDVPQQDESKGVQNGTAQPKPAAAAGNDISGDVD